MAKGFNVSRPTLREALKMLQREGILLSRNGVGTYINVKSELIENPLNVLQSVGKMIRDAGYKESETNVRIYIREAEGEWKEKLQTDERVVIIERTRTADRRRVALVYNIFPENIAKGFQDEKFSGAIFDFLEQKLGIRIAYAITEVCAIGSSNEMDLCAVKMLGPEVIFLKQLHFDESNRPVFYSLDYLKNGKFKLFIKRERKVF